MATGSGDEMAAAAAAHGHLRVSHADRAQVVGILTDAFVEGRLTKNELDLRMDRALASRTYAELATLTADLPAGPAAARPPRQPGTPRVLRPTKKLALVWGACVFVPTAAFFTVLPDSHIPWRIFVSASAVYFLLWLAFGLAMLDAWRGQRPRQPGNAA